MFIPVVSNGYVWINAFISTKFCTSGAHQLHKDKNAGAQAYMFAEQWHYQISKVFPLTHKKTANTSD